MAGLLDFLQGASNAAASNISGPVDLFGMGLRGIGVPVPQNAFLGSQWMRERGLTRDPENRMAGLLGEAAGMSLPIVAAAKAPQIARGLLQAGDNLRAPTPINSATRGQAGMIRTQYGRIPETAKEVDLLAKQLASKGKSLGYRVESNASNVSGSQYVTFKNPEGVDLQVRLSNHGDRYPNQLAAIGERFSVDPQSGNTFELAKQWLKTSGVDLSAKAKKLAPVFYDDLTLEKIVGISVDEMKKRGIYEHFRNTYKPPIR